jgi:hypothetical protein
MTRARGPRCRNGFAATRRGIAVLLLHHSGKSREQRGRPAGRVSSTPCPRSAAASLLQLQHGARFERREEPRPFRRRRSPVRGEARGYGRARAHSVGMRPVEEAAPFSPGVTVRAAAARLGIARSGAGRLRQKAQEDGLLGSDDESEAGGGEDESGTLHLAPLSRHVPCPGGLRAGRGGQSPRRPYRNSRSQLPLSSARPCFL